MGRERKEEGRSGEKRRRVGGKQWDGKEKWRIKEKERVIWLVGKEEERIEAEGGEAGEV